METTSLEQTTALAELVDYRALFDRVAALSDRPNTIRAYSGAVRRFWIWAEGVGRSTVLEAAPAWTFEAPVPTVVVALFLVYRKSLGRKVATLRVDRAALNAYNQAAGAESTKMDPGLHKFLKGAARDDVVMRRLPRKARAVGKAERGAITEQLRRPARLEGENERLRDRALFLLAMTTGMRRSELASLRLSDVEERPGGLRIALRMTKTADLRVTAAPRLGGPDCPVQAWSAWTAVLPQDDGFLFRRVRYPGDAIGDGKTAMDGGSIARILKKLLRRAGFDAAAYSGHSLRRGFITQGYDDGAREDMIARIVGHKRLDTTRAYYEESDAGLFDNHPSRGKT